MDDTYKDSKELVRAINEEIDAGTAKTSKLTDMYIDGKLTEDEYIDRKNDIDGKLQALRLRLADASVDVDNKEQVVDDAVQFMRNPAEYWNQAHISIKKRIQDTVFPEGLHHDAKNGFGTAKLAESYLLITKIAPEGANNSIVVAHSSFNYNS